MSLKSCLGATETQKRVKFQDRPSSIQVELLETNQSDSE
jgi:hypothetical protein